MLIQSNYSSTSFNGHGARRVNDIMRRLYNEAYQNRGISNRPPIIKISTTMKDGVEVTGTASFCQGRFIGLNFPKGQERYRTEFCKAIFEKFNQAITKGKFKSDIKY